MASRKPNGVRGGTVASCALTRCPAIGGHAPLAYCAVKVGHPRRPNAADANHSLSLVWAAKNLHEQSGACNR
jgi:hypothetical protein